MFNKMLEATKGLECLVNDASISDKKLQEKQLFYDCD